MSTVKIRAGCLFWIQATRKRLFEAEFTGGRLCPAGNA